VRKNVVEFIGQLNKLPGVTDIGLSTNATLLAPLARLLRANGVSKVNISLDTLDAGRYRELSGNGNLADALAGLDAAIEAKFPQVKLNMVLIKGRNDDEVFDLIDFVRQKAVTLRFVELMPISTSEVLTDDNFISVGHIRRRIEKRYKLVALPEPPHDVRGNGPALYYEVGNLRNPSGQPVRLGFIGAMTNLHFCDTCNKVRLTADGKLRPCLGAHLEYDIKPVLRATGSTDAQLREVFVQTIRNKPEEHEFRNNYMPGRKMVAIGG
jgi:cyclic pyranopterin phosphate synthase